MAHDAPAAQTSPQKLIIRNIGLMLSGAMEHPILDADTIVLQNVDDLFNRFDFIIPFTRSLR